MKEDNINKITLDFYEEVIGEYEGLQQEDKLLRIYISVNDSDRFLEYPIQCKEAQILLDELKDVHLGTKIGILRTDVENKPIFIRIFESQDDLSSSTNDNSEQYTKEVNKLEPQ